VIFSVLEIYSVKKNTKIQKKKKQEQRNIIGKWE